MQNFMVLKQHEAKMVFILEI